MDIIDIPTLEDGDGDVAQVDGLLTGDKFRCALPILRADFCENLYTPAYSMGCKSKQTNERTNE